jgi:DNA-binding MarR family transcriptional regulator
MNLTALNTARYHGLNLTDLQILTMLAEQGPQDLTAIAAETGLTNAAITCAARKLVGKLLIRRFKDRWTDGRLVIVELDELGRVRLHQITGQFPEPVAAVCDRR